jgi:hypothetical protein
MLDPSRRALWSYILPLTHLSAYLISMAGVLSPSLDYLGVLGGYILIADLPISLVTYAVGWKHPLVGNLWILVVGTLWWYLLSRGLGLVVRRFNTRKETLSLAEPPEKTEQARFDNTTKNARH